MFATKRIRLAVAALAVTVAASGTAAVLATSASASPKPAAQVSAHYPRVNRFHLNGYVINAKYTVGRNTGNTFRQTYEHSTV